MSRYGEAIPMYDDRKLCARIDISKAKQAAGLSVGEDVEITIKGKIKSIRGPEEGVRPSYKIGKEGKEEKYTYPGSIEIELSKYEVAGLGEFAALMDD